MFMDVKSPQGLLDKLKMLPMLAEVGKFFPKMCRPGRARKSSGATTSRCSTFPILQCWPHDGGRFITLPCVITRDPKTGKRNVGMYRMQVYDERTTGMHWQRQKVAAEHIANAMRHAAPLAAQSEPARPPARRYHGALVRRQRSRRGRPSGRQDGSRGRHRHRSRRDVFAIVPAPPEIEEYLIAGFLAAEARWSW